MGEELQPLREPLAEQAGEGDGPQREDGSERHSMMADISRAMVRLYKEQFGRGPTKARSAWAGNDILVCTLEDSLTPAERNLRKMGEHQRLRDMRMFFQYAAADEFIAPVERITGRKVRSFVSGIDTDEDISVELFVLYPRGSDGAARQNGAGGTETVATDHVDE